ncbi:ABC transporter, solute-binding protein [Mobiluncus mulieris ATCC 35239]|uniref:ABC transporter, solute-binding protein n=2 Tax=Mobiluncus mulieris TaxID=2052 RepID=E0QSV0_9ACTO|nr:sugar ABC transporter substrate-binding protein [Mobiluncus mulieris]EEJ53631.1 ABC transporter, solute-binding protein [Mobiluncus mulieris ATCC 35243]EFM45289.1 ABC transporter, solute-binding protein [Mobiluncus mulieris ATCC 35239]MCV0012640.1 sugar ABC transporter substrate-binding protein [Mobiluncus mulieris]SPX71018.1 Maltose/maltodextrin-binding protein precursor [Mobiluncus mulieris]
MNTSMKIGAICVASVMFLTGCSSGSANEKAGIGKETIVYQNFISNGGNEDNLKKIVDSFEKENPDIEVSVKTTDYANYFTQLQTDLSAGTAADVFDVDMGMFQKLEKNDVFADLEINNLSKYRQSILNSYSADGKQLAVPTSFSTVVLFYNKSLFDKAGIEYPTDNWKWNQELDAASKITNKDEGVWGDMQPCTYNEFYKVIEQAGGSFLDEAGKPAFNSDAGVNAVKYLTDKPGKVMPPVEESNKPDFDTNLFKSGKLGMWHTGIWMFSALKDVDFDWDVVVEPGSKEQKSAAFSNAIAVSKSSKHIKAATKFAEYLSSAKVMVDTRLNSGWELPALSNADTYKPYLEQDHPANREAVLKSIDNSTPAPNLGEKGEEINDEFKNYLEEVASGRKSVDDLGELEKIVGDLLK